MSSEAFNNVRHNFEACFLGSEIRDMLVYFITAIKAEHDQKFWANPVTELTRIDEEEGEG